MSKKPVEYLAIFSIFALLVFLGAYSNFAEQQKIEETKLSEPIEFSNNFQRWLTNHKNKNIPLEADKFKLFEENEVYNTGRLIIYPVSDSLHFDAYKSELEKYKDIKDARFSPNGEQVVDFRHEARNGISTREFAPHELLYLGKRKDRIIENKLMRCSTKDMCYIDRAYFVDDDTVVASTFTLDRSVPANASLTCDYSKKCPYIVSVYVMNIATNSSKVYHSPPIELVLADKIEGF